MIFAVSSEKIEWSLDFGPDSVALTVKDLVQEMTIGSRENTSSAWNLLLSRRQEFSDSHSARSRTTTNQQGTHEISEEVLSSAGPRDMTTIS